MGSLSRAIPNNGHDKQLLGSRLIKVAEEAVSRSPLESPPIMKKKLCRSSFNEQTFGRVFFPSKNRPEILDYITWKSDNVLRDVSNVNSEQSAAGKSILKKSRSLPQSSGDRHVQFFGEVLIQYMDEDGRIYTQNETLNQEAKTKLQTLPKRGRKSPLITKHSQPLQQAQPQKLKPGQEGYPVTGPGGSTAVISYKGRENVQPGNTLDVIDGDQNHYLCDSNLKKATQKVNISFVQEVGSGVKLRFAVHVGTHFQPEDIVVKANLNGNKVRIMATKFIVHGNGSRGVAEFNEKFVLPMNVDSYMVKARLDARGDLTVEAPLMTLDRKQSLKSGHSNTS